jgi:hypothetical protein
VKVIVAALTAFLTAIGTTSCMGHGPIVFWTVTYTLQRTDSIIKVLSVFFLCPKCAIIWIFFVTLPAQMRTTLNRQNMTIQEAHLLGGSLLLQGARNVCISAHSIETSKGYSIKVFVWIRLI